MMGSILENARQNHPGESGITLLLTLGIGAPYFQQAILQDLNLTDWMNLRLTNKRHNEIVKLLRAIIMSRCKSRRYEEYSFQNSGLWPWAVLSPFAGIGERNTMGSSRALEAMQSIPSLACTVEWPHDSVEIQPCVKLQGWLKGRNSAGPCSEIVCRDCSDASAKALGAEFLALRHMRFKMDMCRACQTHEMSRHPYGFQSCVCERNLGLVEDGGLRCHNCRATAIHVLLERATIKIEALEYLYRNREGRVCWDTKANRERARWSYYAAGAFPCPGCLTRLPNARWANSDSYGGCPTVQFCTACDGIIVKATQGNAWMPSVLAPSQPVSSDLIIPRSTKETPLTYAALDPTVLCHKQVIDNLEIGELEPYLRDMDLRTDGWLGSDLEEIPSDHYSWITRLILR